MRQVKLYVHQDGDRISPAHILVTSVARLLPVAEVVDRIMDSQGVEADIVIVESVKAALRHLAVTEFATIVLMHVHGDDEDVAKALMERKPRIVVMGERTLAEMIKLVTQKSGEPQPEAHASDHEAGCPTGQEKGLKILLVDDSLKHRRAGQKQLEALGHEVVAVCGYTEALKLARQGGFDAALIDLLMPAESTTLSPDGCVEFLGKEVAVGFPMLMALALAGIPRVAMATDTNHHAHPMSAAVDWFIDRTMRINKSVALALHSPMQGNVKDWGKVLALLLAAKPEQE